MKPIGGEMAVICCPEVPPSGVPHCQHIPDMDSPPYLIRPDRYDVKDKIHVAEIGRALHTKIAQPSDISTVSVVRELYALTSVSNDRG